MSAAQLVGGVVGAAVGFVTGGPAGAAYGFALGFAAAGILSPPKGPTVQGPRLSDLSIQTSTQGAFLPRYYGRCPANGNIFWLQNNKLREVVRKESSGGKGSSGGASTETYTYFATFAIGLGEGPIAGIRRIWCRDTLIYNAGSDDLETVVASNQSAQGWKLYLGTDDQMPDPLIEAEKGVGNTPAYRGTAYIVFDNFELTKYNNSLEGAQFKFEVVSAADYSVQLIDQLEQEYSQPHNDPAYYPKAFYMSEDKIIVYVPQWQNDYQPGQGYFIKHEFRLSSNGVITNTSSISLDGTQTPPNGTTDEEDEYWYSGSVLSSAVAFNTNQGYMLRRDNLYAGVTNSFGGRLYARPFGGAANFIASDARAIAISSGDIIAVRPGRITHYDSELNEIYDVVTAVPSTIYAQTRAEVVNGRLYLCDGDVSPKVYKFAEDYSSYELIATLPDDPVNGYYSTEYYISDRLFIRFNPGLLDGQKTLVIEFYNLQSGDYQKINVADIIVSECLKSELLTEADLDVTSILDQTIGYRAQSGSIRSSVETLQTAYPFDVRQSGYKIEFVRRGLGSELTISKDQLIGGSNEALLPISREMDSQLPQSTHLKYWDINREFATGEEYADRVGTSSVNRVDREVPIVMTADEAAKACDVLQQIAWLERSGFSFSLPMINEPGMEFMALEPGDNFTLETDTSVYALRLRSIKDTQDGKRECEAVPANAAIYVSNAVGGITPTPPDTIGVAGDSLFVPLDIPVIDESFQNTTGFVASVTGYYAGWPGAILVESRDSGQTWSDLQAFTGFSTIGIARNTLPASNGTLIDSRSLQVSMISGTPVSVTRDLMLSGTNYAAYGRDGRWEIVRYQNADLQDDGSYLISGFVRGEKGTEWATGLHLASDYFVPLADPDNLFIGMTADSIGEARVYRPVTSGGSISSTSSVNFTYQGVNLECLSPVYPVGSRDGSGNFSGSFTRRSRLTGTWWTTGVPNPVGEASEAYEIDVLDGSTVVRTIAVSSPSFAYSAADQTADFGAPQSSINFRIYQLSFVVGRGYPLEVTL